MSGVDVAARLRTQAEQQETQPWGRRKLGALLREAADLLDAQARELDELGPLFIRDACRALGVDDYRKGETG